MIIGWSHRSKRNKGLFDLGVHILFLVLMLILFSAIGHHLPDNTYQQERIKIEAGLTPAAAAGPEPWHYQHQQPPQPVGELKVEVPASHSVDHISPDKNSYSGRSEARSGERPYRERERPRHVSPGYDDRRRSRSGSRGREWNQEWNVNGRRSELLKFHHFCHIKTRTRSYENILSVDTRYARIHAI